MPILRNASHKSVGDLRREESREYSAEEMNSPAVKRALRMGLLVDIGGGERGRSTEEKAPQKRR